MNSTATRKEKDGVPVDIYDEPNGVTVGTGSYGLGHGLALTLDYEYVGELVIDDIRSEADTLLDTALQQVTANTSIEARDESTVRVNRVALATLLDYARNDLNTHRTLPDDVRDAINEAQETLSEDD